VVPHEERPGDRGDHAHPGFGELDDPVVAHVRAELGAGELIVGAALSRNMPVRGTRLGAQRLAHTSNRIQPLEENMPEVYVHAVKGRTLEQKRALIKDITDAVVRNFAAPIDAVTVTIVEADAASKAKGGVLFSERAPK
jgi:4-oxalocrotonate tautomerase